MSLSSRMPQILPSMDGCTFLCVCHPRKDSRFPYMFVQFCQPNAGELIYHVSFLCLLSTYFFIFLLAFLNF